jgi:predicted dehydrogenase
MNPAHLGDATMAMPTPRRRFLVRSAGHAALLSAASGLRGVHAWAEERPTPLRLGLIGCGSIMGMHVKTIVGGRLPVSIAWLCDVDPAHLDGAARAMEGFQSAAAGRTADYRRVLADRDVDAVIIATPHHWHAPMALDAMREGKDVYLEKPISHVYREGSVLVEAARRHGRILQQGSQMRSSPVTDRARKLLDEGIIGEVKVARAWTAEPRDAVPARPDGPPPEGVDYDRWLGPAHQRPFNPLRFHRSWRMFRDYGNGDIGDDGIHDIDMAAWGLGVTTPPLQVTARGGRTLAGHAGEFPDTMNVTWEFPDGRLLIYDCFPFPRYGQYGFDNGNVFLGTEGYMVFSRRGAFSVFQGPKGTPGPTEGPELRGQRGYAEHMADFLASVRTRRPNRAPPEVAHRSCGLVHLGEIAFRTRGRLDFDPVTERFVDCDEANALLTKPYRAPFAPPELTG